MTNRLYYDDAYRRQFDALVLNVRDENGRTAVLLDQTAFYPTSGGQPFDTGVLGGQKVVDVYVTKDDEVWHVLEGSLEQGAQVSGEIDWPRRFDHMQQHAGEHMLAGAIFRKLGGHTIGLHLGAEISTIDVEMPDGTMRVSDPVLDEIEDEVNALIQQNIPIKCWFPSDDELAALPLRKPPTVNEHIRIVAIGQEVVACGGTHPSSSGQIGLFKILDARPSKGKMRVSFVCGMRAIFDYRMRFNALRLAAEQLSTSAELLPESVERLLRQAKDSSAEVSKLKREAALSRIPDLLQEADSLPNEWRIVAKSFEGYEMQTLRDIATTLIQEKNVYVLLSSGQESGMLLMFARSEGSGCDMGKLLGETARAHGGKGGGKPDFAQGSAQSGNPVEYARKKLHIIHDAP